MIKKRIIPCLDMKDGRVVKGIRFKDFRTGGDPVDMAVAYDRDGADELVFLDITATKENRPILLDIVRKAALGLSIPFSVGGGVRSANDMKTILRAGADKVCVNTGAYEDRTLIPACANPFGSQCVVLSMDVRQTAPGKWNVFTNAGTTDTGTDAVSWARQAARLGAGEILLTCIDSDGTSAGFAVELTRKVSDAVTVPVIASGGAGSMDDFVNVFRSGNADAALAATVFHFGAMTVPGLKAYLSGKGIAVRL